MTAGEKTTKYESTKRNKMALMKEQNGEDCGKWRRLYFKVVKLRGGARG